MGPSHARELIESERERIKELLGSSAAARADDPALAMGRDATAAANRAYEERS
jgi:hypothetical protein